MMMVNVVRRCNLMEFESGGEDGSGGYRMGGRIADVEYYYLGEEDELKWWSFWVGLISGLN